MAGRKPAKAREREQRGRILRAGIILVTVAVMGSVLYFVYSNDLAPVVYQRAFRLNITYVNPDNTSITREAVIPAGVGVNPAYWNYHGLDGYGVSGRAPLYTLDGTGIIRLQSTVNPARVNFTLGDFFLIWGKSFNDKCIQVDQMYCNDLSTGMYLGFFVNGQSNPQYDKYVVQDHDVIRIAYLPAG